VGYRQQSSPISPGRRSGSDPWSEALDRVVRDPGMVRPVFQPIVDLRRGVVSGYEMLARFAGPPSASPDVWFAEAGKRGLAPELEARMVRIGLEARAALPANTFLTINLDPAHVGEPKVQAALALHRRLNGVVLELTEHSAVDDERLEAALPPLRERGAMVAIDDVGAGFSGLHRIAAVRPHFVKVDRGLIGGLDGDAAQREVVESLGAVANRIDAWVVGEGIERAADLDALMRLRVPLGQGYALGRPQPAMVGPEIGLSGWIKERSDGEEPQQRLWRDQPPLHFDSWIVEARRRLSEEPGATFLAVADELGRPVGLVSRERFAAGDQRLTPALCTAVDEEPAQLARRAMARPPETRFDPLLCCDDAGRYLGTIEIERLVEALAAG
jgi:EAL domain-containing protein (putative c-di-GMP-specific phosphodiesterase class I)